VVDGGASFAVPILLAEFTKQPISPQLARQVIPLITAALALSLTCHWLLRRFGEALIGKLSNELRIKLFVQAEALNLETLAQHHSGYLASLINTVAGSIGSLTGTMVWLIGQLCVVLALFLFFTARESIPLACANSAVLMVFVLVNLFLSKRIARLADSLNRTQATVMERFLDFLTNITTVKRLGVSEWASASIEADVKLNNKAIDSLQFFHANRWFLLHTIFYTALLTTMALLLSRVEAGLISGSMLVLFVAGFTRVQNLAERLSELLKTVLETDSYVVRLEHILAQPKHLGSETITPLTHIHLKDISFHYAPDSYQLRVPEFSLTAGERILITGQSGQGKTTFLSILAAQRTPQSGECLWNGNPYDHYNHTLSHSFAVVSQEAELFNLTLRENLCMQQTIPDQQLIKMLNDLQLSELLASLPQGLDTKVGEKGLRLSAGQKQRINIARALLLGRPILLLDEPTSHLDQTTEKAVIECLRAVSPKTTLVIASHRQALREICGKHYHFEGRVLLRE
jgi:ABC-type bacteriocin/lantibiotic exporter with double-glycine peptidase domain